MTLPNNGRRTLLKYASALVASMGASTALSQERYPSRVIRLLVPVAPGFGTDTLARIIADELRRRFELQVVVENKAGGAGGGVGAEYVFRAEPDGHTLLFTSQGPLGINQLLYANLGYDPAAFVPISLVSESANVLLVRSDSKFKTLDELIATAKSNPGELNYGSGGIGTTTHLAAELFKARTKTDILHVPFKGSAAAATGLMSGQVDLFFGELGASVPHIKSGRLLALGVGTTTRQPLLPDVAPIADTLPGFRATVWFGIVAPPKTPSHITNKASAWVEEILKDANVRSKLESLGTHPIGSPSSEFANFIKDDLAYWRNVISDAGISPQ